GRPLVMVKSTPAARSRATAARVSAVSALFGGTSVPSTARRISLTMVASAPPPVIKGWYGRARGAVRIFRIRRSGFPHADPSRTSALGSTNDAADPRRDRTRHRRPREGHPGGG